MVESSIATEPVGELLFIDITAEEMKERRGEGNEEMSKTKCC